MNRVKRMVCLVLVLVMTCSVMALTTSASDSVKSGIGIVNASALRLREEPSTSSAILTLAYRGDSVVILGVEGEWYQVICNLQTGYMHSDYLTVKERENVELGYGEINAYLVNMRQQPNTSCTILDQLPYGEKAYIIGFNCGWYKVQYNQKTGYIRSDLLDLTEIPYDNAASQKKPQSSQPSKPAPETSPSSTDGDRIAAKAQEYLGVPYVWGGSSPSGFDCSGFTQYVMRACGYSIYRTATDQLENGSSVSYSNLQPGDLVFFHGTYDTDATASHVGIYIGDGDFVHSGSGAVQISNLSENYYANHYLCARRVW